MPRAGRNKLISAWPAVAATTIWASAVFHSASKNERIPMPTGPESVCKLHYTRFHLIWTIPLLLLLYAASQPFLTRLDKHKLVVLPLIALVWTTPWDNELVRQGAWWYPKSCVWARIGYVPVEEYAFFIVQSLITTLLTILFTRWSNPWLSQARSSNTLTSTVIAIAPCLSFAAGITGLLSSQGNGRLYYISMIGWWASIPLCLLWYGTRRTWSNLFGHDGKAFPWLASLALPTVYLCCADVYALRRGTWHIAENKSLGRFVVPALPLEEALFFFVTNLILVSACLAFDRVVYQMRSTSVSSQTAPLSPTLFAIDSNTVGAIWRTFLHLDDDELKPTKSGETSGDLNVEATAILCRASKSFYLASKLLPWDLRSDLGCLYAFARAMDDFVDQPVDTTDNVDDRISILRKLVDATFELRANVSHDSMRRTIEAVLNVETKGFNSEHLRDLRLSALACCHLRSIVPLHLWHQLLDGYAVDNAKAGPRFDSFADQAQYAQNVAGSIGEMCVRVVLARVGLLVDKAYRTPQDTSIDALTTSVKTDLQPPTIEYSSYTTQDCRAIPSATIARILRDARRMGVSLQLINIARDIVSDARELQRCYLVFKKGDEFARNSLLAHWAMPSAYDADERDVAELVLDVKPLDQSTIFQYKIDLLNVADAIYAASVNAISLIPYTPARTGLRVACAVYVAIGDAIRRDGQTGSLHRSHLSLWQRCMVALRAIY